MTVSVTWPWDQDRDPGPLANTALLRLHLPTLPPCDASFCIFSSKFASDRVCSTAHTGWLALSLCPDTMFAFFLTLLSTNMLQHYLEQLHRVLRLLPLCSLCVIFISISSDNFDNYFILWEFLNSFFVIVPWIAIFCVKVLKLVWTVCYLFSIHTVVISLNLIRQC